MLRLSDYAISERIFEGTHSQIYRGIRAADARPCIFKRLRPERRSPEAIARFQQEYEITKGLALGGASSTSTAWSALVTTG